MKLLDFILNPSKLSDVCFLCFKQGKSVIGLNDSFEVWIEEYSCIVTLSHILSEVLPSFEVLANKACEKCTNILLHIFTILQRNFMFKERVLSLIEIISNGINDQIVTKNDQELKIVVTSSCKNKSNNDSQGIEYLNSTEINVSENNANDKVEKYECDKCNMKLGNSKALREHTLLVHKCVNKALICDICGKSFKTPTALKNHLKGHNYNKCPYCEKVLKAHSHFRIHVKNHETNIKSKSRKTVYSCRHCKYQSYNKMSLEAHMNKVHLDLRPYVCDICFKGFYKKSHLTEHLIIHSKDKNDTCEVCGDSFANKKCLTEHLRIHNGQKPYQCNMCGHKFVSASRLSEHIKRKHGEKTEVCEVCGKSFSMKKDLTRHLKKVHIDYVAVDVASDIHDLNYDLSYDTSQIIYENILPYT